MNADLLRLLARHVEAENAHDMEGTLATLHPDCVFDDRALVRRYLGRTGAATYYRLWWDAFGLQFRRDQNSHTHWTTEGRCIAEGVFAGVHVGPFLGVAPTRVEVTYPFIVVVDFKDGLMSGERFYYDLATIRDQLATGRGAQ